MNDLMQHRKAITVLFSIWSLLVVAGAAHKTMDGTWQQLSAAGIFSYLISVGIIFMVSMGVVSHRLATRADRRAQRVTKQAWDRVQAHLDNDPLRIDKYGFRANMEWGWVAELEHELGYTHLKDHTCTASSCWQSDQSPEYVMENGFLAIKSFPELPTLLRPSTHKKHSVFESDDERLRRTNQKLLHGALLASDYTTPTKEMKWGLKAELQARKDMEGRYIPASITAEEARDRGYGEPSKLASIMAEPYKKGETKNLREIAAELPCENDEDVPDLVLKYKNDNYHRREFFELEQRIKQQLALGMTTFVLPKGYKIAYRNGGDVLSVESSTGMGAQFDLPSYRQETDSDWRRDETIREGNERVFKEAMDDLARYNDARPSPGRILNY